MKHLSSRWETGMVLRGGMPDPDRAIIFIGDDTSIEVDGPNAFAIAEMAATAPDLLDACNGLLGLVQMLSSRDDVPAEVKAVLATNHRVVDAQAIVARAEGRSA